MTSAATVTTTATPRIVWRVRHGAVLAMFTAFALNTDPGSLINDTKIDLVLDPGAFLARAVHLWDPLGSGGQLQNQAYGYLFPMGPFFWVGDVLGAPGWVTQRLWWALLLGVSYVGFVVLARRLEMGQPWSRMLGGVAFALSPLVLTVLGRSSIEAWPPALAPWILLPLVGQGMVSRPWRAAACSGLAIACTGGVNAAVNVAAVLPTVLWLVTRPWSRAHARLVLGWGLAALAATTWWIVPLLALGRYSPPFLNFIESASVTTSTTALVQTLRGTANWVAYAPGSGSQAGVLLLTSWTSIVVSVVVTAAGLGGLALRRTPQRPWLLSMVFTGVTLVTLGHDAVIQGFAVGDIRAALDGVLAPIRNVHKFDILIRLATSLGLVLSMTALAAVRRPAEAAFRRGLIIVAAVSAVGGLAAPFFGLIAAPTRSFAGVPSYWEQSISWLAEHSAQGRTLMLPGSRFAEYYWGYPGDEPIQATSSVAWDVRNAVPLTQPEHVRWLDGIERRISEGQGGADLAPALAEAGVGFLLVRTDVAFGAQGATRPTVVRGAIAASPGLIKVATFGPGIGGPGVPGLVSDFKLSIPAPAVEIYAVTPATSAVTLESAQTLARVVGGPEAAVQGGGVTRPFTQLGATASPEPALAQGPVILTDTPRRREVNVGVGAFGASSTLTMTDPLRLGRSARDYAADDAAGAQAVAVSLDGVALNASSSAGDADTGPWSDPGAGPSAAFDASLRTTWRPNPAADVQGAWLEARFPESVSLAGGSVLLDPGTAVRTVTLTTDTGTTSLTVIADRVDLPETTTRLLRVTIGQIAEGADLRSVGVRTIAIPAVTVERTLALPTVGDDIAVDQVLLHGEIGRTGCVVISDQPTCAQPLTRVGEDAGGLDRLLNLPTSGQFSISAQARAVPDPALIEAVAAALTLPLRATATSVAVPDLAGSALAAVDGDSDTAWVATTSDPDPTVTVSWDAPREVSGIRLTLADRVGAMMPDHVRVVAGDEVREVDLDAAGMATFEPLTTSTLDLHVSAAERTPSLDPYLLTQTPLAVGVSELVVEGAPTTGPRHVATDSTVVDFGCEQGPDLTIGSATVTTQVSATVAALIRGELLTATPCDPAPVDVSAGVTRVRSSAPDRWELANLTLTRQGANLASSAPLPGASVASWEATERVVDVPARATTTVLRVRENTNPGWRATLNGAELSPVTLNGWQQGWVVPAGAAGQVRLTFTPDAPVRTGMLLGALLPIGLLGLALRRTGRVHAGEPTAASWEAGRLVVPVTGGLALTMAGGPSGLVLVAGLLLFRFGPRLDWAWGRVLGSEPYAALVAGLYAVAGLTLLLPTPPGTFPGNGVAPQLASLAALAVLLASGCRRPVSVPHASDEPTAARDVPGTDS